MGAKLTSYSTRAIKQQLASQSFRQEVEAVLTRLSKREQQLVQIVYGLQDCQAALNWTETAERMGMAMSTCRTVHNRAIAKIVGYLRLQEPTGRKFSPGTCRSRAVSC